jgi:hypothetical protein
MFEVAGSTSTSRSTQSDKGLGYKGKKLIGLDFEEITGPIA